MTVIPSEVDPALIARRLTALLAHCGLDTVLTARIDADGAAPSADTPMAELTAIRPGLICVSINCYGHDGPWVERPGWDQLAAAATGLTHIQGEGSGRPKLLRGAACDYVTGYLGALGAMAALQRCASEGGSWLVRVSLAQTGVWLRDFAEPRALEPRPDFAIPDDDFIETQTLFGLLKHLAPVARMGATQPRWERAVVLLGSHAASFSDSEALLAAS